MKSIFTTAVLATLCLVALSPQTSFAQCSTGAANDDEDMAIRSFGTMYVDPVEIAYGESFVIDCDSHLTSVEVSISLPIQQVEGRRPVEMGDLVQCTVYDETHTEIMSEQVAIPTAEWSQKLTFDFSSRQFRLSAGLYYFLLSTPEDCWSTLVMGTEYPDGDATLYMLGTWTTQSGDTMFNIQWDSTSDYVADEGQAWGTVKSLYR